MSSPFGKIDTVYEPMVVDPSDMIAIGDSFSTPGFLQPSRVERVHNGGANIAFCDGHVEFGKHHTWTNVTAMVRWNRDHQPHLKE